MRYTPETVLSYLQDPRDRALMMQNPPLPMPRYGDLPSLEPGERRYVIASDGLYVQARTHAMEVCVALARSPPLPFGPLVPKVELRGGLLPRLFIERMRAEAVEACPDEWAALVHWDSRTHGYVWTAVQQLDRSPIHIRYESTQRDESHLVLDVHSHGRGLAFFSSHDDASDCYGVYFACVLGRCESVQSMEVSTRLVIDGIRIPLPWNPWEGEPAACTSEIGCDADRVT